MCTDAVFSRTWLVLTTTLNITLNQQTYPCQFINKLNAMVVTCTSVRCSEASTRPSGTSFNARKTTLEFSKSWWRRQNNLVDNDAVDTTTTDILLLVTVQLHSSQVHTRFWNLDFIRQLAFKSLQRRNVDTVNSSKMKC